MPLLAVRAGGSDMDTNVQKTYIVQDEGYCGGQPIIEGSQVKVEQVAFEHHFLLHKPDRTCDDHPGITLAQVHAALSYYHDHRQEVDEAMRRGEQFADFKVKYRQRMGFGPD